MEQEKLGGGALIKDLTAKGFATEDQIAELTRLTDQRALARTQNRFSDRRDGYEPLTETQALCAIIASKTGGLYTALEIQEAAEAEHEALKELALAQTNFSLY